VAASALRLEGSARSQAGCGTLGAARLPPTPRCSLSRDAADSVEFALFAWAFALSGCSPQHYSGLPPGDQDSAVAVVSPFELGLVRSCEDPMETVAYDEVAMEMGIDGEHADADHLEGGLAAVEDFDDDGDLDILVSYAWDRGPSFLYRRDGDGFLSEPLDIELGLWVPSLVDLDADGDRDLLMGGEHGVVYFNQHGILVRGVLPLAEGASLPSRTIREFVPGDLNNDGLVDLYALCTGQETGAARSADFILWAEPDGTFRVDTETVPSSLGARLGFDALTVDVDGNGWLDVYADNDKFGPNLVLYNDQGALSDGSDSCHCALAHAGMGVDIADFNRDGWPDFYLAGTEVNRLLLSESSGTYYDATLVAGASPLENIGTAVAMTWGAVWLDFDNDTELDVLVAQGDLWGEPFEDSEDRKADMPLNLLQSSAGLFEDVGAALGLDQGGSFRSVVASDMNADGVLDLFVTEVSAHPQLYMSQGCTANGWLEVEVPHGARVEVTAGGITQTDWVMGDSGWGAAQPLVVHFGLGAAEQVDRLRVVLPGQDALVTDTPFAGRRRVTLAER
jgi:enediyne biosynthesis protein E4